MRSVETGPGNSIGDGIARLALGVAGMVAFLWPILFPPEGWLFLPGVTSMFLGFLLLLACAFFHRVSGVKVGSALMSLTSQDSSTDLPPDLVAPTVADDQMRLPDLLPSPRERILTRRP